MKILRNISFGAAGVAILAMAAATILEKTGAGVEVYRSWWFIALWTICAVCGLWWMVRRKVPKRPAVFLIHVAFVVILVGALVTHLWGTGGRVHLRMGEEPVREYHPDEQTTKALPFSLELSRFDIEYHRGTPSPADYRTVFLIDGEMAGEVSMNKIFRHRGWRFYQSAYDPDGRGSVLTLSHDPAGIAITYAGYLLLLLGFLAFFASKESAFRSALRRIVACGLLFFGIFSNASAGEAPSALPEDLADAYGDLFILYNGRVCPMETFARDFCMKLYGKPSYEGLSAEQVLTGWIFDFTHWKDVPCIKIKEKEVRRLLEIDGSYASLSDFFTGNNQYKLDASYYSSRGDFKTRPVLNSDEKFTLISTVCSGSMMLIFPYLSPDGSGKVQWFSAVDNLPMEMAGDEWLFIRKVMNLVQESVTMKRYEEAVPVLQKVRAYQVKTAGEENLPSALRLKAEHLYNLIGRPMLPAMLFVTLGIILFVISCICISRAYTGWVHVCINRGAWILGILLCLYLSLVLVLRGIVAGHVPMSNGFETMTLLAWVTSLVMSLTAGKFPVVLPFGYILCGFAMLVSVIGVSNPQIGTLMPVLASPLLSVHVACMMVSYSLLGLAMLNSAMALFLPMRTDRMKDTSLVLLYPAVFLLAAGTFIGAVWANVSWGSYWSWDPKETWALITLLVYVAALHSGSLPAFRKPRFFHIYCVAAFLCVLITYFGVNLILGGMHSYA